MANSAHRFKLAQPLVIDRRGKRKRSAYVDEAAHVERHMTRAADRAVKAFDKGVAVYRKGRKKSRRKRSADFVLDIIPHTLDGAAVAARKMSLIPVDLMRAAYTRRSARLVRSNVKAASRIASRVMLP